MADSDDKKGTLTRRMSRRFSKKVIEEDEKGGAPSSPVTSSVGTAAVGATTPTMRRSGSMGSAAMGMPLAAEVERQFVVVAKKLRLPPLETRTSELKGRMMTEWTAAQRADPGETARLARRMAKKPKAVGLLGLHAYVCEREAEWLVPFVKEGGGKQLMKVRRRQRG